MHAWFFGDSYDVLDNPNWASNILNELVELNQELETEKSNETEKIALEDPHFGSAMIPGHCRSEVWSCLSSVLERGIRYVKRQEDVIRWRTYTYFHARMLDIFLSLYHMYLYYVCRHLLWHRAVQTVLYKTVFHGGVKSMWTSIMEIEEMRRIGACIKYHDSCVEHAILSSYM